MKIEDVAYWGSFVIPLVLLAVGAWIQKLVDGKPFRREHFFLGLDLTVYFLAATMINFLDIAKRPPPDGMSIVWTVVLLLTAIVMLLMQMGMHQTWASETKHGGMQIFMLCYFSNFLGIILLYGFVRLKTGGII
jgi:hypothetical protein